MHFWSFFSYLLDFITNIYCLNFLTLSKAFIVLNQNDLIFNLNSKFKKYDRIQSGQPAKLNTLIDKDIEVFLESEVMLTAPWWSRRPLWWLKMFGIAIFIWELWSNIHFKMLTFWGNRKKLIFSVSLGEYQFFEVFSKTKDLGALNTPCVWHNKLIAVILHPLSSF